MTIKLTFNYLDGNFLTLVLVNIRILVMERSAKILILIFIGTMIEISSFSQYFVKSSLDSIPFEIDSVILAVESLPGTINWEKSQDAENWESLGMTNDSIKIRIDHGAYYRATYFQSNCLPVFSDTMYAGFKASPVNGNQFTIDSTGGVFILVSGIKVIVPPGAVKEKVSVTLELLDSLGADIMIPFTGDTGKVFCAGIYTEPTGLNFLKPIKIKIPSPKYHRDDLPSVYLYDQTFEEWEKYSGHIICNENQNLIEFSLDNLGSVRIHLLKDILSLLHPEVGKKNAAKDCKEGFIDIISKAYDYSGQIGTEECYVSSDNTSVRYLECPGQPVDSVKIQEIGKGCKPKVEDNIKAIKCLKKGEEATITISVTIGGMPLENQQVVFSFVPYGLTMQKKSDKTDQMGKAEFLVKCDIDKFSGEIEYNVQYSYYLQIVSASSGTENENNPKFQKTGMIVNKNNFIVCPRVNSVSILKDSDSEFYLTRNQHARVYCECRDQYNDYIDCGEVVYSIKPGTSYPYEGSISVDPSSGIVTGNFPGVSGVEAIASGVVSENYLAFSVAYEGDLHIEGRAWDRCECDKDTANQEVNFHTPWDVFTTGDFQLYFWFSGSLTYPPWSEMTGSLTYKYIITDPLSYCSSSTVTENVESFDGGYFTTGKTDLEILFGSEFMIVYRYKSAYENTDYIELPFTHCKLVGTSILVSLGYYMPHFCSGFADPASTILK